MSVKLMTATFDNKDLNSTEKLVMLALADHANDDGESVYPSQQRLSDKTGLSRKTVNKTIGELVEKGYIIRVKIRPDRKMVWEFKITKKIYCNPTSQGGVTEGYRGCNGGLQGGVTEGYTNHHINLNINHQKDSTSAKADVMPETEILTTSKKKEEPTDHQEIVDALVIVTGTDMKLKSLAGQLVRHARELRIAGYTAQDILDFGEHWKRNDWRYRQDKQLPSTMTVLRDIGMRKVTQQLEDENFRHYTQEEWDALNNKIVQ